MATYTVTIRGSRIVECSGALEVEAANHAEAIVEARRTFTRWLAQPSWKPEHAPDSVRIEWGEDESVSDMELLDIEAIAEKAAISAA